MMLLWWSRRSWPSTASARRGLGSGVFIVLHCFAASCRKSRLVPWYEELKLPVLLQNTFQCLAVLAFARAAVEPAAGVFGVLLGGLGVSCGICGLHDWPRVRGGADCGTWWTWDTPVRWMPQLP